MAKPISISKLEELLFDFGVKEYRLIQTEFRHFVLKTEFRHFVLKTDYPLPLEIRKKVDEIFSPDFVSFFKMSSEEIKMGITTKVSHQPSLPGVEALVPEKEAAIPGALDTMIKTLEQAIEEYRSLRPKFSYVLTGAWREFTMSEEGKPDWDVFAFVPDRQVLVKRNVSPDFLNTIGVDFNE